MLKSVPNPLANLASMASEVSWLPASRRAMAGLADAEPAGQRLFVGQAVVYPVAVTLMATALGKAVGVRAPGAMPGHTFLRCELVRGAQL